MKVTTLLTKIYEKLEKKMNDYGLEDWQKDLVRKR